MKRFLRSTDGVYHGWIVTFACFLGSFIVFGLSYSFGVFFEVLIEDLDLSRGRGSLVFSIHTVVLYVGAVGIGGVIDRYGPRRPLVVAGLLLAVGLFWTSRADSLFDLILGYGIIVSIGLSVIFVVSYATVPQWFGRRRGLAAGIASSGLGVGMVIMAPAAAISIAAIGWRMTYVGISILLLGVLALAIALIAEDPTAKGIDTGGEFAELRETESIDEAKGIAAAIRVGTDRSFVLVFLGWICVYSSLYVILVHLPAFIVDIGMSRETGALALGALGAASGIARIGIGYLSDRIGRVRTFVVCSAIMGLTTVSLAGADSAIAIGIIAILFGIAYGGNGALLGPLIADLFGMHNLSTLFGLMSVSFAISGLLAPFLAGTGHDVLQTYIPAFLISGAIAVVGSGLIWWAGRREGVL